MERELQTARDKSFIFLKAGQLVQLNKEEEKIAELEAKISTAADDEKQITVWKRECKAELAVQEKARVKEALRTSKIDDDEKLPGGVGELRKLKVMKLERELAALYGKAESDNLVIKIQEALYEAEAA